MNKPASRFDPVKEVDRLASCAMRELISVRRLQDDVESQESGPTAGSSG